MTTGSTGIQSVMGIRGLKVFGGLVREEYLVELRDWQRASRIYREMADDVTVGTLLDAIMAPLLAADFDVLPLTDSEADMKAAEFVLTAMNQMDRQTWRAHVVDMLESLIFGFAVAEVVLEKREDGKLWIRNLEPRGAETLWRWEWEDDRPTAFVQRDPVSGAAHTIPMGKMVHVAFRGRKGNPQGKPLLRSLFRPWLKLKYLENFEALGIERDVGGMPVIDFPDPDKWHGPSDLASLKTIFQEALENLRMAENMWLLLPPGARAQSWGSGPRSYNIREAIVAKQKEILMRFFAQFLMLGMGEGGTQALVKGSQSFFVLALKSIQQELLEAWNQQLVPLLMEYNHFPGITGQPVIAWNDPGAPDIVGLLTAYGQGVTAQVLTPTRQDEEHLRAVLDLPDLPDDEGLGARGVAPGGMFPFAEAPAGQQLRLRPDRWDDFLNSYQKELVSAYDPWMGETRRIMERGITEGWSEAQMDAMLRARLQDLETDLTAMGRARIFEGARLGLGQRLAHRANSPGVQRLVTVLQGRNAQYLAESLIPDIRAALIAQMVPGLTSEGLRTSLGRVDASFRPRVASYSGGATVAIFDVQRRAGVDENAERRSRGEPIIPVRWVLDPTARHCQTDSGKGTFGCPGLARVYAGGWDSLPTVPAGNVSCLANCRCHLEADYGNGWERG